MYEFLAGFWVVFGLAHFYNIDPGYWTECQPNRTPFRKYLHVVGRLWSNEKKHLKEINLLQWIRNCLGKKTVKMIWFDQLRPKIYFFFGHTKYFASKYVFTVMLTTELPYQSKNNWIGLIAPNNNLGTISRVENIKRISEWNQITPLFLCGAQSRGIE